MSTAGLFLSYFSIGFGLWTALMVALHFLFTRSVAAHADRQAQQRRRIRRHVFRIP